MKEALAAQYAEQKMDDGSEDAADTDVTDTEDETQQ